MRVPSLSLISADLVRKIMGLDLKTIKKKYYEISDNFRDFSVLSQFGYR